MHSTPHPRSSASTHGAKNRWGAVVLVAAATCVVVAAEMTPVGLLSPMSASLHQSEGTVGLSLTITGVVAAFTAPFMPIITGRIDRRSTLIVLMLLVAVANALTALSTEFLVLASARVVLGVSMGGVWSLAASLAPRLVTTRAIGLATTIIFSGIAIASVVGVPAAATIGDALSWNAAFWTLSGAAALIALAMIFVLPTMPSSGAIPLRTLVATLRNHGVRVGLVITALLVMAHFTTYTYVRPALEAFAGIDGSLVGTMLLVYGILGVIGTFSSGPISARKPGTVVIVLSLGLVATLALMPVLATTAVVAAICMAVWGLFYGGVSVSTQAWVAHAAPEHRESVSALWVSVFNASIAVGALTGGPVLDAVGPGAVFWVGAGLALIALLCAITWTPGSGPRRRR